MPTVNLSYFALPQSGIFRTFAIREVEWERCACEALNLAAAFEDSK